ncbi:MAG: thioredoxin family protein [Thermodesulfobacteriota bacterium]|nr:thioredoxin family protein [Thermodesulfobacteriota bacterium]
MGKVKVFWKMSCPKCKKAIDMGSLLKEEGFAVTDYNLDTFEGLAEASFYGVMSTPSIIIEDSQENLLASFPGDVPRLLDIREILAKT